jgi:hypothetical protein
MVWFVALVAILNLGLGYALAVYLGAGRNEKQLQKAFSEPDQHVSNGDGDEYDSVSGFECAAMR